MSSAEICLNLPHSELGKWGRFTRDIADYELTLPHRVSPSGEFISFSLPSFYKQNFKSHRKTRDAPESEKLFYNIIFDGRDHHVELWPNHDFVSPNLVTEVWRGGRTSVNDRKLKRLTEELCHYVGHLRGDKRYSAAISLCDGLAGYLMTDRGRYFIEPLAGHQANSVGEHVHVIYKRRAEEGIGTPPHCATFERWEDAWQQRLRDVMNKQEQKRDHPNTNMHSVHRYVEMLVVVDKKFIDYHKNDNMETYILTIMNMVSKFYHDISVGNQVDVHVVRVIYLEKPDEHIDLEISRNAEKTLVSFCDWAKSVNPHETSSPQHHDIAVLLTRFDLCSDNVTDCNLMGLAFLASACDPDKSCAINEDSGLSLGITVTHEVGHVMGCGHDNGEDSPCYPQSKNGDYYIMSPYVHMQTTQWSPCSKKFMTELFENQLGECLNDEPQESLYKENDMPPGAVYDSDYQCNLAFPGSTHCILEQSKVCEMLYCKIPGGQMCSSKGDPPADGTKCGENLWCYNSKCVEMGQRPQAVDGGWGDWQQWSECSRTCGGGVSYSERDCNNPFPSHNGRYCIGERKRVKLCNTNECPPACTPFRDQQCSDFNGKPFKDQLHKWKPYFIADNPCQLNCINENHVYVTLAPRVKDGTSCKPGTKNKCIFGACRKIGCDWQLDSNAVEDICGVCNGDGTHCTFVDKVYTDTGRGYQKICTIPGGSRNIRINEMAASENTIAVSDESGKTFYLNGGYSEEVNGDKDFGGVRGTYDHPSEDKETLFIAGPLPKPIVLQAVFYNQHNPGISYKYAEPLPAGSLSNGPATTKAEYYWDFLEFGDCSSRCGPGTKTALPSCVERHEGKVGDKLCDNWPRPEPKTMECRIRECKTEWHPRNWGPCSGCEGKTGSRTRQIDCVREASQAGKDPTIIDDSKCSGPKPACSEVCCSQEPCKQARSTDEFERKIAHLWSQLEDIKNRRRMQKEEMNEEKSEKKNYVKKLQRNIPKVNSKLIQKYIVNPRVTKNGFDNDLAPVYNKYTFNKRNTDAPSPDDTCTQSPKVQIAITNNKGKEKAISDHIPAEGNKLIEVPIKEAREDVKLSDVAFETEGDKVADTLDFCNAKIFNGKLADEEIKRLKANGTANH